MCFRPNVLLWSFVMTASTSTSSLTWSEHPGRALLKLAWPITVSMVSFSTMTLASTAFVAHVGSDELAGVGLAGVVGFALVCFGIGLLRGAKTLVSQAVGADRRESHPRAARRGARTRGRASACSRSSRGQLVAPLLVHARRRRRARVTSPRSTSRSARSARRSCSSTRRCARRATARATPRRRCARRSPATRSTSRSTRCSSSASHWGVRGAAIATICGNATELAVLAWPMRAQLAQLQWSRRRAARRVGARRAERPAVRHGGRLVLDPDRARRADVARSTAPRTRWCSTW